MFDLDRYYTPASIAEGLIESAELDPRCCIDSTCGDGSLLKAAGRAFPKTACVGIDNDRAAIARLKRTYPKWHLSVADILDPASYRRARAIVNRPECDLLLLNPPFSMNGKKRIEVMFNGWACKCSVAMAHILTSVGIFAPKAGAAIVPESLLYSDIDECGRQILARTYSINVIAELQNTTFNGARVNAIAISLNPKVSRTIISPTESSGSVNPNIQLVRGNLPVFKSHAASPGLHYIHSSDITQCVTRGNAERCVTVRPAGSGIVSGAVILIPRVGLPNEKSVKPLYLRSRTQLSDCVIAMRFGSMESATEVSVRLKARWSSFVELYKGTGARYVTMDRLTMWLDREI